MFVFLDSMYTSLVQCFQHCNFRIAISVMTQLAVNFSFMSFFSSPQSATNVLKECNYIVVFFTLPFLYIHFVG